MDYGVTHRRMRKHLAGGLVGCFCAIGFAQDTKNMAVLSNYLRPGTTAASSGIWGWTGSDGKEYALLTSMAPGGLSVVDLSDPAAPKEKGFIPSLRASPWQEVASYGSYGYKISQTSPEGLQIIDLSPLNQGLPPKLVAKDTQAFQVAHTLYCDSTSTPPRLYVTPGYNRDEGVVILSLANPAKPVKIGTVPGMAHDMYARGDLLFVSTESKSTLEIWNVADATHPVAISRINFKTINQTLGEPAITVAHSAWLSEDGKLLFTTEETAGASLKAWDIGDLTAPRFLGSYLGFPGLIAHNAYVRGKYLYVAHFSGGLRIVDFSDPAKMKEVAFHRPNPGSSALQGSWGAYPWFKTGIVIHGDTEKGLYVCKPALEPVGALGRKTPAGHPSLMARHDALHLLLHQTGSYSVSLYTLAGDRVFNHQGEGQPGMHRLALGDLSKGTYMARLGDEAGFISVPVFFKSEGF